MTRDRSVGAGSLMPVLGRLNAWVYRLPLVGETLVRRQCRAVAALAFHMPLVGGKSCRSIQEVKAEWIKCLGKAGISIKVTREDDKEFEVEASPTLHPGTDACPTRA